MNYRDIGLIALFLVAWVVLNRWVLPGLGIPTCMSGRCQTNCCSTPYDQPAPPVEPRDNTPSNGSAEQENR